MQRIKTYMKRDDRLKVSANDAVSGILRLLRFDPALYAVFDIWDREVKGLVRGCTAVAIQGTRLCVSVPSAVHKQELMYSKERILKRVNQAMGRNAITDIVFELKGEAVSDKERIGRSGETHGR